MCYGLNLFSYLHDFPFTFSGFSLVGLGRRNTLWAGQDWWADRHGHGDCTFYTSSRFFLLLAFYTPHPHYTHPLFPTQEAQTWRFCNNGWFGTFVLPQKTLWGSSSGCFVPVAVFHAFCTARTLFTHTLPLPYFTHPIFSLTYFFPVFLPCLFQKLLAHSQLCISGLGFHA